MAHTLLTNAGLGQKSLFVTITAVLFRKNSITRRHDIQLMTLSIMIFSITTFSIMTFSIMTFGITINEM